ncbi:MAG: TolC family protein [Deltaproteobacteria bacterium]|nr:TolC family protein [Deltaproteobacteria bacterium]MDQ3297021.1 TolC family protein [Myxococcota bacterium]
MRWLCISIVLLASRVDAAPQKLTLEQVIARAVHGPKVQMADGDTAMAAARVDEADAARMPRIKATAFGTISPDVDCENDDCTVTGPRNFAWGFDGLFGGAQLDVTQPLYTFGKISHARAAARAGLDAQRALANETAGDLAVDAARAYWGVKLARELGYMLDDGVEEIAKAIKNMEDKTGADAVSVQDRQRVAVLLAEAKVQRADATAGEQQALAGLRALTGLPDADIDDTELAAVVRDVTATATGEGRPQALAAKQGARAYDELARMARSYYFPDVAVVASALIARAQGVDDPPSVFANDPYNRSGVGVVLALQWQFEPWTIKARVDKARGEAQKARAQSTLAAIGARYDAETAHAEAIAARDKVSATNDGVKAARTWLASVLQAEAVGAAEPKDLADAYIAWFQMRARWAQAVFQWNVAVVRLGRASGEFRAGTARP